MQIPPQLRPPPSQVQLREATGKKGLFSIPFREAGTLWGMGAVGAEKKSGHWIVPLSPKAEK